MALGDRLELEALRRLSGKYRGSHWRRLPAGDGTIKELVWACKQAHPTQEEAVECATRNMLVDTFGRDR